MLQQDNSNTDMEVTKVLVRPAIGTQTAYGNRYTTVLDYGTLHGDDLDIFSNKTAQRVVKKKRAEQIAKSYFNILTKDSVEDHELPFQSSFVFNLNLKENGLSEENLIKDGYIQIPCIKDILSIRDGGHRKVASGFVIEMLDSKIANSTTSKAKRAYYEHIKRKFLELSFTADIYVDLDDTYSKRCLLDLGKSEPVSPGREFYFLHDEFADAIEYLSNPENISIYIDLDNSKYSKYNKLSVPLNYVSDIIKVIGDALYGQNKLSASEINQYLINFMTEVLLMLKVDTFSFKNNNQIVELKYLVDCKVNLFTAIKRLLNKVIKEEKAKAISKVMGVYILYSKLGNKDKKDVLDIFSDVDLIAKFDEIKEFIKTQQFKADVLFSNQQVDEQAL